MNNSRVKNYLDVIQTIPNTSEITNPDERFQSVFKDFHLVKPEYIKDLYAQEFYFNDTFKTFNSIDELVPYMVETAKNVDITTVNILDVSKSQSDYYLRWEMEMKFTAKGKDVYSHSIGMTQLRFNDEGKIILHQDYWDGAEGFYMHLPYIGYFVSKIRENL